MEPTLRAISIKNLRSISMTEKLKMVPITILVGKNSAGKSTFARSFPLIRQSCEAKKRAPILWFGDRIDYGSFDEALQRGHQNGAIEFTFDINVLNVNSSRIKSLFSEEINNYFNAEIFIRIKKSGVSGSFAPQIRIRTFGFEIEIKINELNNIESLSCGDKLWKPKLTDYTDVNYRAVLPFLIIMRERDLSSKLGKFEEFTPFSEEIFKAISNFPFSEKLIHIINSIPFFENGKLLDYVFPRLNQMIKDISEENRSNLINVLNEIQEIVFASKINDLLTIIDNSLREYYTGIKYIEPLRATAQRYYRKQELAIDEIDSKGENVAMYLDNLGPWALEEFGKWTKLNFGFEAKTQSTGGHVAIVVREEDGKEESNLADIGFGFSQILPVITQIWASTRRSQLRKRTSCLVIEQPELHLHPALQAKLADVFAAVPREINSVQLVIETHSNHLINRFGQLISEGKLSNDDVQILLFEKTEMGGSLIRKSGFDKEGYLINWPVGFFEPGI